MISRVLLLGGVLVLGGCGSAGAPSYSAAAYPEEASAPPPAPVAADGYGYSFEAPAGAELQKREMDMALTQVAASDSNYKAKKEGGNGGVPQGAPGPAPDPIPLEPQGPQLPPEQDKPTDQSRQPMLIYSARLGLAVFKVQEQLDTIETLAKTQGGYLVTRTQNEIRVRVPAAHFQEAIDAILKLGDINFRQVTTDDVTAEYTDLEIRLKNALSVRDRLQLLLEKAQKVEEAIEVERELQRVTNEIETMKGRLKLLSELAAYSTIDVSFSERSSQLKSRVELPFPWLESLGLEHLLSL